MNKIINLILFYSFCCTILYAQPQIPNGSITLTDESNSNALVLIDNATEEFWLPGWREDLYPAHCYIDLGETYDVSKIEFYDVSGSGSFKAFTGSPGDWNGSPFVTDLLNGYNVWSPHTVSVTTRFIRFEMNSANSRVSEIRVYGTTTGGNNEGPMISPIGPVSVQEGGSATPSVTASNTTNLSVISILPAFIDFSDLGGGTGMFNINPLVGDAGTYNITVQATGPNGTDVESFVVTVIPEGVGGAESICDVEMVQLILGGGDPGNLFDEQVLAGNPANGTGGAPITYWFPGWFEGGVPAEAYADLGSNKSLTRLFLRDVAGEGVFEVYTGSPNNWSQTPIIIDNLGGYQVWNEHDLNVTTRYLKFRILTNVSYVSEVLIYGDCSNNTDVTPPGQVVDLNVTGASMNSVSLSWTAPGDNGSTGTAASYDLRYSTSPINDGNFDTADQWPTSNPQVGGSNENVTVSGLNCETNYHFALKATDDAGNTSLMSNVVVGTTSTCGTGEITITVNFNGTPTSNPVIDVATLRYNKDFAYSLSFDDGMRWEYTNVFPVLEGGVSGYVGQGEPTVNEPGKFYTDGCGNDIPFKAALSLNGNQVNAANPQYNTIISWSEVTEIYNAGWDIYNHSWNHCAWDPNCNYPLEVTDGTQSILDNLGFLPEHFVVPSNDNAGYVEPAFNNNMLAVYTQSYEGASSTINVDNDLNFNDFLMLRNDLEDPVTISGTYLDEAAIASTNGAHHWINEYGHTVGYGGASIDIDVFRSYMEYIENTYGSGNGGPDRVWVASMQTVYEYLVIRQNAVVNVSPLNGNQVTITVDLANVPMNLRHKALSFVIDSNQNFTATATGANIIHNEENLINIDW